MITSHPTPMRQIEQAGLSMKLTLAHESGVRFEGWGLGSGVLVIVTWKAWQDAGCPSVLEFSLHATDRSHPDKGGKG